VYIPLGARNVIMTQNVWRLLFLAINITEVMFIDDTNRFCANYKIEQFY